MADFRQLALEFVLVDEAPRQTAIAQQTASAIQSAPSNSNPVARWVEAVQPWMPGSNGEDLTEDGEQNTDWTARAKALEYLSRTLDFVDKGFLKPSQVKLLISFFGAMFDIDHKAGILASATALSRIIEMKSFQPQNGHDIIQKVCALKDDFPRQIAKTRQQIYELLHQIITDPATSAELKKQHGPESAFMKNLLSLCQNERAPDCLIPWFRTLSFFLAKYEPVQEVLDQVYETFKAYFPITVPRASASGITPEDLKLRLRECFSSSSRLAPSVFPFLLSRLDQGDGVTINVKVDVLRTIKACIEQYSNAEDSVEPYVNQVWGTLKYEVRNGEIEDTIWATLEVLKSIAVKLQGDSLRDYTLTVTRDCINDLSNPIYTAAAGRVLISVASANASAFNLMVAPALTHIKENLRHPKSPTHTRDLLKLLHVVLETRLLLTESDMSAEDRSDFTAIDGLFKNLYDEVYRTPVSLGSKAEASEDDLQVSTQAVQGAGALVCQRRIRDASPEQSSEPSQLLPEATCDLICDSLFSIILHSLTSTRTPSRDELVNETAKALQRATAVFTKGFGPVAKRGLELIHSSWASSNPGGNETIETLGPLLAFTGCSETLRSTSASLDNFMTLMRALLNDLIGSDGAISAKAAPETWCALMTGIQSTARYFNDACKLGKDDVELPIDQETWSSYSLEQAEKSDSSAAEARRHFLLTTLLTASNLYRQATVIVENGSQPYLESSLQPEATGGLFEHRYLHMIASLAGFAIHEMSKDQQDGLRVEQFAASLFQLANIEGSQQAGASNWDWLVLGRLNVLCLGMLEALRPSRVAAMFDSGIAQELIASGSLRAPPQQDSLHKAVTRSILTMLANKHKIETLSLISDIEKQAASSLAASKVAHTREESVASLEQITSVFALTAGMLRRAFSKEGQSLLQILRDAPKSPVMGLQLARRLEMVVAPQEFLTKENFAVVKPLWMQRAYMELVKPMLTAATEVQTSEEKRLERVNLNIAVLVLVRHMNFPIFEQDADQLVRVAISTAQNLGVGPDTRAALEVLRTIMAEASEKTEGHIRSIVNICINSFSARAQATLKRPDWLPASYTDVGADTDTRAVCSKLALDILGGMPKIFEARYLLPHVTQVAKELSVACGHRVREVRSSARLARNAWVEVK